MVIPAFFLFGHTAEVMAYYSSTLHSHALQLKLFNLYQYCPVKPYSFKMFDSEHKGRDYTLPCSSLLSSFVSNVE